MKLEILMMTIMGTAAFSAPSFFTYQIPRRYCVVKNCHVCVELLGEINQLEQPTEYEFVCLKLVQQKRCCEHYLRRSKGYQF